jgi:hypothetical protein
MSDVKLEVNSAEEVAYKLMCKVLVGNITPTKQDIFEAYEQSLKIVRGWDASEVLAKSR